MTDTYIESYGDFSRETTQIKVHCEDLTGLNFLAIEALAAIFSGATGVIVSGTLQKAYLTAKFDDGAGTWPASPTSQREMKWLVQYRDDVTTKRYSISIGTAELGDSTLLVPGTDIADLTDAKWIAWVVAFENFVQSPAGNATTVEKVTLVGRNL